MASSHEELVEAQSQIWRWTFSHLVSMSIKCAINLRIPDAVHKHGQPAASLSELISALRIPPSKTHAFGCMMRVLSTRSTGFFSVQQRQQEEGGEEEELFYSLTPASRLLLRHEHLNQASLPLLHFHPAMRDYCSVLDTWLLEEDDEGTNNDDDNNKRTAFEVVNGASFWDYLAGSSGPARELKGLFYDCMVSDSKLVADALVVATVGGEESLLFRGVRSFVDVAGGTGIVAAAVAGAFPEMKCVVLDLPHVVEGLPAAGNHPGNLEFVGGDMFRSVPSADAILLKWILHNWDDESCVKILKCCKAAVSGDEGKKGKVIVIDMVMSEVGVEDDLSREIQLCFDLMMATVLNGKERNEMEWKGLFEAAGFSDYKIVGQIGPRSIIEVYP
ncbi:unnamed protein product [Linum trigynum]|uniref:Uncharacterized protein n=1 Tax=Linum trigynum TaxID=586398 RepID=A0AAV2DGG4_9ROSI